MSTPVPSYIAEMSKVEDLSPLNTKNPSPWETCKTYFIKRSLICIVLTILLALGSSALACYAVLNNNWYVLGISLSITISSILIALLLAFPIKNKIYGTTLLDEISQDIETVGVQTLQSFEAMLQQIHYTQLPELKQLHRSLLVKRQENVRKQHELKDLETSSSKELSPKEPSSKELSPKESSPKELSPKELSPKESSPKELSPKKPSPKESSSKELSPKKPSPKESSPKELSPKKPSPKELSPKESSPKELSPKESSPKELSPKESSPKEPSSKELSPKESSPKELSPKESSPKELSPKESSPKESSPKELSPKESSPKELSPKESSPKELSPKKPSPKESSPKELSPKELSPKESSPKELSPKESSPKELSPKKPSPKEPLPKEPSPKEPSSKEPSKFSFRIPFTKSAELPPLPPESPSPETYNPIPIFGRTTFQTKSCLNNNNKQGDSSASSNMLSLFSDFNLEDDDGVLSFDDDVFVEKGLTPSKNYQTFDCEEPRYENPGFIGNMCKSISQWFKKSRKK